MHSYGLSPLTTQNISQLHCRVLQGFCFAQSLSLNDFRVLNSCAHCTEKPRTSHMTCNFHALLASVHLYHPILFPEIHGRIWDIDEVVPLVFLFCSTNILGLLSYFSPLPKNAYTVCIKRRTVSYLLIR